MEVIDCAAGALLRALPGHPGVAGVLISQAADLLFTSDRAAAQACIYRCSDEPLLARVSVEMVATIPLSGRPRWAARDPVTGQVFVNIRDPAQILAIGAGSLTVGQVISVPAAGPHGLWLDGERLFCAADGGVLVVLPATPAPSSAPSRCPASRTW